MPVGQRQAQHIQHRGTCHRKEGGIAANKIPAAPDNNRLNQNRNTDLTISTTAIQASTI